MANRNDEYGREQQSSSYGRSGSGQDPERGQSRTGSQRYQAQNQNPQDSQQNPYQQNQPRYQSQGQQSQGGEVYQSQRYGAGNREYGSDDWDSQRHENQGQGQQGRGQHQMYGRGEQFNEFDERAQSWEQERGSDYSPGSYAYASQEFGQGRQQTIGQRGQQYPSGPGGSYRSESLGYGAGSSGRMAGEGYGSSSGYGGGMSGEYGAQTRGEQFLRPGDTQSSARSGMSGMFGGSSYGTSGLGTSSSTMGRGYSGVGPKNYSRSDERIREDLCERLTQDDDIDASEIEVKAEQGLVTLEGTVEQRWMKHRAEDIADSCSGVRQVDNRIRVQGSEYGSSGYGKSAQSRTGTTGKTSTGTSSTTTTPSSGTTPH